MKTRRVGRTAIRPAATGVLIAAVAVGTVIASSFVAAVPAGAAAYSGDQWGLDVIGAPSAWALGTGQGVTIGIVDTGVDYQQQDLAGKIVAGTTMPLNNESSGCATAQQDQNGQDDNGHGTHVAGIATASGAYGVSGVAPGARLVVAKVLDCKGSGSATDVANGIQWVVAHGAKVVNLSIGDAGTGLIDTSNLTGSSFGSALQAAWDAGAIPVVAAGNNGGGLFGLGNANYSGIPAVVVAATGSPSDGGTGQLAWYSNSVNSAQWGVAAPGGDADPPATPACGAYTPSEILSTFWTAQNSTNCYASDEGTSMATPFVSGALALLLGRGLSPTQAVQTLLSTANRAVACGSACSGLVNIAAAMQSLGAPRPASSGSSSAPPAPAPASHGAVASSSGHGPGTTTSAAPTSTTEGPTTSTSAANKQRALDLQGKKASGRGTSAWWLVVPVLVGVAAAGALGLVGRRRNLLRHAASPAPDPSGSPPPA